MKLNCLALLAWLVIALPVPALAQASAPAAKTAPTAASAAKPKPSPNLMTPEEKRDTATRDLQPDRPVEPQISIPLGGKAKVTGKTTGGIDDATARCKAEPTEAARAACRERAAQASKSR